MHFYNCKKLLSFITIFTLFFFNEGFSQIKLTANGEGDTYELINKVLISENRTAVEVPDCNHKDFGRHISEVFDSTLNKYVFEFIIHIKNDKDRCKRFDRQRNEIKAHKRSNPIILATEGEKLNYKWKFKLQKGFKASSRHTNLHQITYRLTETNEPLFAFMARDKKGKRSFDIVYIDEDVQQVLSSVKLSKITGKWIVADETITFGKNGSYAVTLKTLSGKTILKVDKKNIQTWYETMEYARPKWGIYRSLKHANKLRDEKVYFADFEINDIKTDK
ncbi:fibronectin type III [Polaribacter sp. Asnod6-C07]|uniref:fibronectin type III n=1 Tax=Polaribacter sp. Asnod6-C07 TaxID=3160582 RepID=UPI003865C237